MWGEGGEKLGGAGISTDLTDIPAFYQWKWKFYFKLAPIVCAGLAWLKVLNGWAGRTGGDLFGQLIGFASKPRWSHEDCKDDNGAWDGGYVRADPRSAAFYCTTPKGFIMPFVITLTAVNTGESFYVPDQCERFGPVINQGRNLLWSNLTLFIKDNSRAPLKCHTIYLWHNLPAVLQTGLARFLCTLPLSLFLSLSLHSTSLLPTFA